MSVIWTVIDGSLTAFAVLQKGEPMRLIDADEFEKRIKPYDTEDDMDKALYNFAHYHLITTPSAQPEIISTPSYTASVGEPMEYAPIVRCKDCTKREYCRTSTVWAVAPSDDWFCADAERSTE